MNLQRISIILFSGIGAIALVLGLLFSAQAGLMVIAAAWLAWVVYRYPKTSFFLLVFFIPLFPLIKVTEVFAPFTLVKDVVIATLAVKMWILPILQKRDSYRRNDLLIPVCLFIVWAVFSFLLADQTVLGLLRLRDLMLYIPLLWVARALISSREDMRTFSTVFLSSAGLVFIMALLQLLFFADSAVLRYDPIMSTWIPRLSSTFGHPNLFGTWLIVLVPFAGAVAFWERQNIWLKRYAAAISIVGILAVYLTISRGVWIALVATLIVFGLIIVRELGKHSFRIAAIGSALAILAVVSVPNVQTFLRTVVDPRYESNRERIEIFVRLMAEMSPSDAVFGQGLGDTLGSTAQVTLHDIASVDTKAVRVAKGRTLVDNAVLKTWVEMGVVGVVLLGWITVRAFLLGWSGVRRTSVPEHKIMRAALASTVAGFATLSLFLDVPEIFPAALLFWTFIGVSYE